MKSLVIYDSVFGNTAKVAQAVGKALGTAKTTSVVHVGDVQSEMLKEIDLLVVGSPTRGFRPMEGITKFIKELPAGELIGKHAAAFDTRMDPEKIKSGFLRFIVKRGGYADKAIVKGLLDKGAQVLEPSAGFYVKESEGPLEDGELERAAAWAKELKVA